MSAITDDKNSLAKSKANLQTILDHADSGHVLYNADLKIVQYNSHAQKLSGLLYNKVLVEGNYLFDYFPEDRHQVIRDITTRVLNGEEISYEIEFINDGAVKWINVKWVNVKNADHENWGLILTSKDITESKLAALKMEKLTLDLMRRNKALEQFTSIAANNLKSPVGNIISLIQLFYSSYSQVDRERTLGFILTSAKSLDGVINDINMILDIQKHKNEGKEIIDLKKLVDSVTGGIAHRIVKEEAIIDCYFPDNFTINSIRSYLYSIFYNLILNSIKLRRPDITPRIIITGEKGDNEIKLSFNDNGQEISHEENGKDLFGLYERFYLDVEGSGLELFLIKTQVQELGGSIAVKSKPGEGNTFEIILPH